MTTRTPRCMMLNIGMLGGRSSARAIPFLVWQWCNVSVLKYVLIYSCLQYHLPLYFTFIDTSSQAHATHFWLNEGWTTWMERLLLAKLHTPAERDFSYLIGLNSLEDALKMYENQTKYQRLVIEFEKGEDPDDAYSRVPYDKGANLILHIGEVLVACWNLLDD